ncbi:MAG: hydrogenase expression/formation protein HypE, partial [Oscillospiraceae bacterium]|nr:hydrogenase expression/formation protein HypE [Oscillospiraceae bacterium]
MKITMAHGSGGRSTSQLIDNIFRKANANPVLDMMEDSAVVDGSAKIAVTTDSFVVTPLFFRGGDIGRLAVCGTVNDLLMRGATPKYITSAYIIEEGADTELLSAIADSMAKTAEEAGVTVIAGDTKVIGGSGGVYINTTGVGFIPE